jgi:hypothetical protein
VPPGRCWCYATDHLGTGPVGFGLLATAGALGGLLSTSAYGGLERHVPAQHCGLLPPCWVGFVVTGVFLALIWRQLKRVVHPDEEALSPG